MSSSASLPAGAASSDTPRQDPPDMDHEASILYQFSAIPTISKAFVTGGDGAAGQLDVTVTFSQRNIAANVMRKYNRSFTIPSASFVGSGATAGPVTVSATPPAELKDAVIYQPSPSGEKVVVMRKSGEAGSGGMAVEVWAAEGCVAELQVPVSVHGPVYNDGWFGSGAVWDKDEKRVVYVAEAPPTSETPSWGAAPACGVDNKEKVAAPKSWKGVGEWQEDWGELNVGKKPPALFVLDVEKCCVEAVEGLPQGTSCGQAVWTPDGEGVVFVSWPHLPTNFPSLAQRLGVAYCFNRPCSIWAVPLAGSGDGSQASAAVCLTPRLPHGCQPRFTPDGTSIVFLSHSAAVLSGKHAATVALFKSAWKGFGSAVPPDPECVVDVVRRPTSAHDFPGLYSNAFINQPFIDGDHVLLTSQWRSSQVIVRVNVRTGEVTRVTPTDASWTLLAVDGGVACAVCSAPNMPYKLMMKDMGAQGGECTEGGWTHISINGGSAYSSTVASALQQTKYTTLQVQPSVGPLDLPFEVVVLYSDSGAPPSSRPAILMPHGGPHSAYPATFYMPLAYLVHLGYNLLLVNFRGSTGFGEDAMDSLPGHISHHDVTDCMDALKATIDAGLADGSRVAVSGGSHGGFLTGNLIGQFPDAFQCAVMRNPVCNIALMVYVTDIMDWCYVEALGSKDGQEGMTPTPTPQDLQRFFDVSPIAHVHKVKAPLMVMLGAKDRRVPYEDGKRYVAALRAQGKPSVTRVMVFPEDTHALDKPQTEFEQYVNIAWWLKQYV